MSLHNAGRTPHRWAALRTSQSTAMTGCPRGVRLSPRLSLRPKNGASRAGGSQVRQIGEVKETERMTTKIDDGREAGFRSANLHQVLSILFGLWCHAARVRPGHSSGPVFAWLWTVLELGNGIGHTALALSQGG